VQQTSLALPLQVVVPKTASDDVRLSEVQKIYQHPAYKKLKTFADLSLLKVNNSISFSPNTLRIYVEFTYLKYLRIHKTVEFLNKHYTIFMLKLCVR
jgi:hypothetical protein